MKQRLLREHQVLFKGYLFDGTRLFTTTKVDIPNQTLELLSRINPEDEPTVIVLKFTGELSMTDVQSLQVLNLIVRGAMQQLNLQLVGRNFYDAAAAVSII